MTTAIIQEARDAKSVTEDVAHTLQHDAKSAKKLASISTEVEKAVLSSPGKVGRRNAGRMDLRV